MRKTDVQVFFQKNETIKGKGRLLRNPKISSEIDRLKADQAYELKLDVRDVLQKYIDIAFADITDFATFGKKEVPVPNS
ncbi:terminase small subunit [Sporosarcina sp. Te-1]|uniref:terminase small subunit n=1 Tax=Sporosarcina sp. Te-1 TaxID=2818390 RepID=UPI001FB0A1F3|nr:terminase small subunit [Sporosarcina sp. Te-1]